MRIISLLLLFILPPAGLADVVVPADKVENSVNIRLQPDATSDVIGKLQKGESLPHVGSEPGWHEVQLEGDQTGYISADWCTVRVDEPGPVEEAVAEAEVHEDTEVAEEIASEAAVQVEEEVTAVADVEEVAEVAEVEDVEDTIAEAVVVAEPEDPPGPAAEPPGLVKIKGADNFLVKFRGPTKGGNSQIYDNGNQVGIGTTEPKQRLEVNGSIQIHEQNSSVAGLMITQSSGDTGYIMHNLASTLTIGAGSQDRITIDREGNVGIAVSKPSHPLEMASGAHVTAGGVWTNRSSRQDKENILALPPEMAMDALMDLEPVLFNYRSEQGEVYAGFIAEDVPDVVASNDRQGLSTMDIVAVLTRVVQEQQQRIEELEERLDE